MEVLTARPRTIFGKSAKNLRNEGFLPAVAYGKGLASEHIAVPYGEFVKVWKAAGESSLVLLKLPTGEKSVLVHDVALDPIKNTPVHADFYVVDMKREVEVDVPLEFTREADAGKASGGILVKVMHELKVKSLPGSLPHSLVVDVSHLQNPKDAILEEQKVEAVEAPAVSEEDALKNIEVIKPEKKTEGQEEEDASVDAK